MDPANIFIVPNLPWIIGGGMTLGAAGIGGWVFTTWLRVRHGYPLQDGWGRAVHATKTPEGERMIAALIEDNRRLVSDLGEMKSRVAVLERLATDPATRLDREIAGLDRSLN